MKEICVFGASDGLVAATSLILVEQNNGQRAVLLALVALLLAGGLGMAASQYLSDPKMDLRHAAVMGAATSFGVIVPGIPWLVTAHALVPSMVGAVIVASLISWLRPGTTSAFLQTFGVLAAVAALAAGAGHL